MYEVARNVRFPLEYIFLATAAFKHRSVFFEYLAVGKRFSHTNVSMSLDVLDYLSSRLPTENRKTLSQRKQ